MSILLILLVFCVVFFLAGGVRVGVYVAHLVSFLCCVFLGSGVRVGVYVAHLVSFLCCVFCLEGEGGYLFCSSC